MPSSTSNFKYKLRLPRLFFAQPLEIAPREYDRPIPPMPWPRIAAAVLLAVFVVVGVWEVYCRSIGYVPTLNDNEDLWAQTRRRVKPESLVVIGDSRAWFDLDLDELQKGLGKRPVQLALAGSCAYPILADLAEEELFHGTIICGLVPRLFFAPPGTRAMAISEKALRRYRTQTLAQRTGQHLTMLLQEHLAFLQIVPERSLRRGLRPYFRSVDRERRARMFERIAVSGELQKKIQRLWLPLFIPPPPPNAMAREDFMAKMNEGIEGRLRDIASAVAKLHARGGKIVFVRLPVFGELKSTEDENMPRTQIWEPLLKRTGVLGIYFEDFPELMGFHSPEGSHLSAGDSVEFSKRLVPRLRTALEM